MKFCMEKNLHMIIFELWDVYATSIIKTTKETNSRIVVENACLSDILIERKVVCVRHRKRGFSVPRDVVFREYTFYYHMTNNTSELFASSSFEIFDLTRAKRT